jgi:tripartite-type tricarboxylate transporter receptor subunit TctC
MKKKSNSKVVWIAVFVLASTIMAGLATPAEKGFPNREIEIVVPYSPGGMADLAVRILSDELSKSFGVPVVVVNNSASGGVGGVEYVARSKPDGHTMLAGTNTIFGLWLAMQSNLPYKISDFIPIARYVTSPNLILVRKEAPWKTLNELVIYAKKNPGKLTCGTTGVASASRFSIELLNIEAGLDIRCAFFTGGGPTNTALLGGKVDIGCIALPAAHDLLKSGDLRALASTVGRITEFPEIPTVAEEGYPGATLGLWTGLFTPKGVEKTVLDKISKTLEKVAKSPQVMKKHEEIGFQSDYVAGDEFARGIEKDYKKMVEVVKKANIVLK